MIVPVFVTAPVKVAVFAKFVVPEFLKVPLTFKSVEELALPLTIRFE